MTKVSKKTAKTVLANAAEHTRKTRAQPWSKDDLRTLKTMARAKEGTPAIARQLGRTPGAVYQMAARQQVHLGGVRRSKRKA
jgi:hypothetical protein